MRKDGLAASPLGGRHRWTVGSPNNGEGISLAAWEVAVRHGEVASSAWPRPMPMDVCMQC
jgi:hypothetical protein